MKIKGITGRDSYIIGQALAYASEWMRSLGLPHDEPSNRHDMDRLLSVCAPGLQNVHRTSARNKLRNRMLSSPDEWVAVTEADNNETDAYLAEEAAKWG